MGLKQAPRAWLIDSKPHYFRLGSLPGNVTLLVHLLQENHCFLSSGLWNDVILVGNSSQVIPQVIHNLNNVFALKDLGVLEFFLGIEVERLPNGSSLLSQRKYIRDLLEKTKTVDAKSICSPMTSGCKLRKECADYISGPSLHRSVIGALQYAIIIRPGLSYSIKKVFGNSCLGPWKLTEKQ